MTRSEFWPFLAAKLTNDLPGTEQDSLIGGKITMVGGASYPVVPPPGWIFVQMSPKRGVPITFGARLHTSSVVKPLGADIMVRMP